MEDIDFHETLNYKNNLRVNGTLFAKEVQVKIDVFFDYVF